MTGYRWRALGVIPVLLAAASPAGSGPKAETIRVDVQTFALRSRGQSPPASATRSSG